MTVNGHFQRLFTTLFGGGEARLEMVEGEDPLEGGLEIVAKPPGKKPATLSLLSGGEQSLTALALIFAVFLTNPSPICVLDEVDAPLDDANVDRFCTLMEKMAADTATRFLVITHHPMTMDAHEPAVRRDHGREGHLAARLRGFGNGAGGPRGPRGGGGGRRAPPPPRPRLLSHGGSPHRPAPLPTVGPVDKARRLLPSTHSGRYLPCQPQAMGPIPDVARSARRIARRFAAAHSRSASAWAR